MRTFLECRLLLRGYQVNRGAASTQSRVFEALATSQRERLLDVANRICGKREDAEDSLREGFARAWRAAEDVHISALSCVPTEFLYPQ